MFLYSDICNKIEQWEKAYSSRYNSFQNHLIIAFNDENSIWVNDEEKVECAKYVIVIIKMKEPYIARDFKRWNNDRLKVFYFVKHEYGDFYEMNYLPIEDGWKIKIRVVPWNYRTVLDGWQVDNINHQDDILEVEILRDFNKDKSNRTFEVDIDQIKQTLTKCFKYIKGEMSKQSNS